MRKYNSLNPYLSDLGEDVMGFLNEIQLNFPNAISLASGRPDENYFNLEGFMEYFNIYVDWAASTQGKLRSQILNNLGQYNRTKGIVNDLVSKYLSMDEKIDLTPSSRHLPTNRYGWNYHP